MMRKIIWNWSAVLVMVGILCFQGVSIRASESNNSFAAAAAAQGAQDFILVNKTGVEIYALYVTPHNSDDWGDDILGVDTLQANNDIEIKFSRKEKAKFWDLRIEDADGEYIEWESLNLLEISTVTLYYKNGKATAIFDENLANLNGNWVGYYDDGTKSPYIWAIRQTGAIISIENVGKGEKARSRGRVVGNRVLAQDFATQNAALSADGTRIMWTDGVIWVKVGGIPNLNGNWVGYYDDGTKSPYIWAIRQTGATISIENVGRGEKAKSRGRVEGERVLAQDFATQNGTLSADGKRIRWSDGVVWIRQ